ncbi:MAG: ABC transporter permease [Alphaproteobacteria bacterium]|nr:ABC transporter permease [Rhodospirillaceae bacterium]MBT6205003.1 ABC transporter permease [Rhodospirillaceae bacterium]MBT6511216.1 ABC transporter permease [Rhodospirillaceae bacterium]MBT7649045.1 ABC transporter permease [Rhodospirillaceae bacterium]MDG2481612.1 ABC transporter permease [Alphaproteobacteria bacterium]
MVNRDVINPEADLPMPVFNHIAVWSLYRWEVRRYLKGWQHSIVGPIGNVLLYLAIFGLALGSLRADVAGLPFLNYVAPGLVTMTAMLTAFEMTAWATIDSKIRGNLAALLSTPMRPIELTGTLLAAGMTAGMLTGTLALLATQIVVPFAPVTPGLMLLYGMLGTLLAAACGLLTGFFATKFDQVGSIAGLVVGPLIFLSGVFFPVSAYSWNFDVVARFSPAFWAIDGVRRGDVGVADGSILATLSPLVIAAALAVLICQWVVATGFRVKQ